MKNIKLIFMVLFTVLTSMNPIQAQSGSSVQGLLAYDEFNPLTESLEIRLRNYDTGEDTEILSDSYDNFLPTLSIEAQKIAFISDRDGDMEIYTINLDGSHLTQITQNAVHDSLPIWSPDGTKIMFISRDPTVSRDNDIYTIHADGTNPVNLTQGIGNNIQPSWSADGTRIIFVSYRDNKRNIYHIDSDGQNLVQVTDAEDGSFGVPVFSPDATKIAFAGTGGDYYVMDTDGTHLSRITQEADKGQFDWADHDTLLYESVQDGMTLINIDGSQRTPLGWSSPCECVRLTFDTLVIDSPLITQPPAIDTGLPGTGLRGEYFDNADLTGFKFARINAQVNFDWGTGSPDAIMGNNTYSIRWVGQVETLYNEPYTFYVKHNDGARLWVNGQSILNTWANTTNAVESSGVITLAANQKYDILLEYYEDTGNASVKLEWASTSQTREVIPQIHLYPPEGQLAFTATTSGNSEVYIMNPDGSGELLVGTSLAADNYGVWSPDGNKIAFVSERDGNEEIYVVNADGTGLLRLTNHGSYDRSPTWSPDGTRIAFVSGRGGDDNIWVVNANGTSLTKFTANAAQDTNPTWSPTGRFISFVSNRGGGDPNLWIMSGSDGTSETQITTQSGYDLAPFWSPDGSKIAFRRNTSGNDDIWVVNTTSPYNRTRLTNNPAPDYFQSWSPDGSRILFLSTRDGNSELFTIDANGSEATGTVPVRLTNSTQSESYAIWSADGRQIAFIRSNDIHIMNSDGSNERRITTAGRGESELSWWQPRQAY